LRDEIEELRASRTRIALAADADRRRLEHDLHDGVQQRLIALAVSLQLAASVVETCAADARTLIDEMQRDVQHALDEAASLAQRIYPSLPGTPGLVAAVRSAAAGAGRRVHIDATANGTYPPEVLVAVYAIFVELLEREAAEGSALTVTMRDEDGALTFELIEPGASNGPTTAVVEIRVRDRVEALGGSVAVEPKPGGGRIVAGSFPLSRWS